MASKKNAEEIFNKAIELSDSAEQAEYLDRACAGNDKLRAEVDALLKWHEEAGDFLEVPPVDPDLTVQTSAVEGSGTVIGRYKLLEKVGEGGMATVYMAEQKRPIRRRVALKIIKLGMDTKQVIGRFEAERQALAMMDHPNVAKVLDAGTTETGRPYFVMELVRGLPITEFCDKNSLTTRERLELFTSVCQAVQHAHQRGIIHRDIKPSNVLVTLHDGEPVAKVIDFGIAKAVNQQLTEKTVFTRYSQMIGTPEYMSPEQAEMSGLDIDTRTDVFSLGVLLYELLTGTTPFDSEYLLSKGYSEMQRIIREEEPIRPSTKVSTLGEALTEVAKHRRTSPEILCKLMRTDLDWIVMKTLEKDRSRRYESVSELAADIQRHLQDEPVLAGRPSSVYRVQKFIKRNKVLVTSASVIVTVLIMATVVSLWQMVRANRAANQLQIEKDRAEANEKHARLNLYAADMKAVQQNIEEGNLGAAQRLLHAYEGDDAKDDIRGWEWRYLWDRAQGDQTSIYDEHEHTVTCVAFSPNGKMLASGGMDGLILVRDQIGKGLWRYRINAKVNSLSFSNDSRYLAVGHEHGARMWSTDNFTPFKEITLSDESLFVAFSPTDSTVAFGYGSGPVKIWDYTGAKSDIHLGRSHDSYPQEEQRWWASVAGCFVAFSSDGKHLVKYAAGGGRYEVWDIDTAQLVASLETPKDSFIIPQGSATFLPGKRQLFVSRIDTGALLWDYQNQKRTVPINGVEGGKIVEATFSVDGTMMVTAGLDHTLRLWDVSETPFREEACLLGHESEVWTVAFSPDGKELVSGGQDTNVMLWTSLSAEVDRRIRRPFYQCIPCFSADGQFIALAHQVSGKMRSMLYNVQGERFLDFEPSGYPILFSDNGREVFTINSAKGDASQAAIAKWSLAKSMQLWESEVGAIPTASPTAFPSICETRGQMATGWSDGSVQVIDYKKRQLVRTWKVHDNAIGRVLLSPDGGLLFTSEETDTPNDRSAVMWRCSEDMNRIERLYSIEGHQRAIVHAEFSPTNTIFATAGIDSKIMLWNTQTGALLRELVGHKEMVRGIAFSPDGRTLASASLDETVRLWHVATGRELITLAMGSQALFIAFSPDGSILAAMVGQSPYAPDELKIWRIPTFDNISNTKRIPVVQLSR